MAEQGRWVAETLAKYWTASEPPKLAGGGRLSRYVLRGLNIIHDNFASPIQLGEIARGAGLSLYYFIRRFKAETGHTPHAYLVLYRVNEAQRLLVTRPDLKVRDVGASVGYHDATAFTRLFRKQVGLSPTAYREERLVALLNDHPDAGARGQAPASGDKPCNADALLLFPRGFNANSCHAWLPPT